MKIIIVSGYFNPVHIGHIEYFKNARSHGEKLIVIVNNDIQRELKGSKPFQNQNERCVIISNLKMVDEVVLSIDEDRTVNRTLEYLAKLHGDIHDLSFANGGDQNNENIPEKEICFKYGISLIDNLGKKIQSSSWLLSN